MIERHAVRDSAAAILANHREPLEPEMTHDLHLVERQRALGIVRVIGQPLRLTAVAVAAQIRRDDGVVLRETGGHVAPREMRLRRAVQQQQRRAAPRLHGLDRHAAARLDAMRGEAREQRRRAIRRSLCARGTGERVPDGGAGEQHRCVAKQAAALRRKHAVIGARRYVLVVHLSSPPPGVS